jgi:hypothetical protein
MVAVALLMATAWGGSVTELWQRTFAPPCPRNEPAPGCLASQQGMVVDRFDDRGDGDSVLTLTHVSGGPQVLLALPDAERLGVTGDVRGGEPVTVTLFGGEIVAVTGPNGRTAQTERAVSSARAAFFRLWAVGAVVILAAAGAGFLWRRGGWLRPAVGGAAVGILTGTFAGGVAENLDAAWAMPATTAVAVVVSVAVTALVPVIGRWSRRDVERLQVVSEAND